MMKAATLTLNPCLDRTMYFDNAFTAGELNRASGVNTTLGGKGTNVSRFLKILGVDATAYGFAGGDTGATMERMLTDEGISYSLVKTKAPTRMNIKMIDKNEACTEANEAGGPISEEELSELMERLSSSQWKGVSFFLGGSIPHPVDKGVYNSVIKLLKNRGARVILDCDGEALKKGIEACPSLIKPNLFELSGLMGKRIETPAAAVDNCKRIYVEKGISVLCTMSEQGAVYVGKEGTFAVTSPQVTLRGFTGAGDSFLSAFCYMMEEKADPEYALRFASSAAAAKVELPGSTLPSREAMEKYINEINVYKYS